MSGNFSNKGHDNQTMQSEFNEQINEKMRLNMSHVYISKLPFGRWALVIRANILHR